MPTLDQLVAFARVRLKAASFKPSPREALLLAGRVLGLSEAQVLARGGEQVPDDAAAELEALLSRRLAGEPVAYLLGEREFYGRVFAVDDRVLIPRPETEHLVEAALALPLPPEPCILDLGTGSGILAVTLAAELPRARVVATDLSPAALAVAAGNARRHGVSERLRYIAADWTPCFRRPSFDLVVSNPPYVPHEDAPRLSPEVRDFEPAAALFAGEAGLAEIRRLLAAATALPEGAFFAFEIGDGQLPAVEDLLASRDTESGRLREAVARPPTQRPVGSPFSLVEARADYAGKARVVVLKRA